MVKKRIAFIARFGLPALGGGEYFHLKILKYLKELGYEVFAACYFNPNDTPFQKNNYVEWEGVPVFQLKPEKGFVEKFIIKTKPDLVLTHSFDSPEIVSISKKHEAKTIQGVHFWRNICEVEGHFVGMLDRDLSTVKLLKDQHKVFYEADKVYVNSRFMQLAMKKYVNYECDNIIHPTIDLDRVLCNDKSQKYITLINPDEGKGGALFIELAKRLCGLKFLCVGKGNEVSNANKKINKELEGLSNVEMITNTDDAASIYEKTKILLVPSIVDETFSMVALEAMFNGIPVLASTQGNLPYLVEEGGLCLPCNDVVLWEKAIDSLNNDKEFYQSLSIGGLKNSKKYLPENELEKFQKLVYECIGDASK